jgi:hypothetical protein
MYRLLMYFSISFKRKYKPHQYEQIIFHILLRFLFSLLITTYLVKEGYGVR